MNNNTAQHGGRFSLKVYLIDENSGEKEIRRFNVELPNFNSYDYLVGKIRQYFPGLSDKEFAVYWEDEGEKVIISSDTELGIAMQTKTLDLVKRFYLKVKSSARSSKKDEDGPVHFGVICDECNMNIIGIRYKCGKCADYDLCSSCREADCHSHHPMYRIPHPDIYLDLFFGGEKHRSRRHSDAGKKKRRFEKRESGPETGDEMEDLHHGKYSHKKCKKAYKCRFERMAREGDRSNGGDMTNPFYHTGPYSQLMNDFLGYFNPINFAPRPQQNPTDEANDTDVRSHISYLKNLGSSLQKILDPLGVSVEFEVRPKKEATKENKEKDEKQPSGSTSSCSPQKEASHSPQKESSNSPQKEASNSPQKEVRFPTTDSISETMKQRIEEITKMLSNQTVNNDSDNGWVSFEELKKGSEEPQPSTSTEAPKTSPTQASAPEEKKEEVNGNQNLYPNLTETAFSNPAVRTALENMLAMGFTNEGNWLASLLEAKNGDIFQALEALSVQKKFTK